MVKNLRAVVGEQYAKYADEEDIINFAALQQKGRYARFIEEVEKNINTALSGTSKEIRDTVEKVYTMCYNSIADGVKKSVANDDLRNNLKGIKGCTPETAKRAVEAPIKGLKLSDTLEKNRKEVIYNIKKDIVTGLTQGDRYSTAARRITDKVDMSYGKSIRIVRTETHRAREGGIHDSSNSADEILRKNPDYGLRMVKIWRNMGDSAVRPGAEHGENGKKRKSKTGAKTGILKGITKAAKKMTRKVLTGGVPNHIVMENQTVLQNEMFDLGDGVKAIAPGHSGVAGHDCNCRCFADVELMTEEEFFKATGRKFDDNSVSSENKVDNSIESGIIKLTEDETRALNQYISSDSYKINEKLRSGIELSDYDKELVRNLDSALDKMPNYNGNVKRVLHFDSEEKRKKFVDTFVIDKPRHFEEYLSSSIKKDYNLKANVIIYIENSKKGKDIRRYNPKEQEILFPRDSRFKVNNIIELNGVVNILLRE